MAEGTVTIKLAKSLIGSKKNQIATAHSLGLRRIGDVSVQPDCPATQGKLRVLAHLIEEVQTNETA